MPNIRKSTAQHKRDGTYRADRHADALDEHVKTPLGDPPDWLNPLALAEWTRVVGILAEYDVLRATDEAAMCLYCCLYSEFVMSQRAPGSVPEFNGSKVTQLRQAMADLGLNPAARSRIKTPTSPTKPSSFDDF